MVTQKDQIINAKYRNDAKLKSNKVFCGDLLLMRL